MFQPNKYVRFGLAAQTKLIFFRIENLQEEHLIANIWKNEDTSQAWDGIINTCKLRQHFTCMWYTREWKSPILHLITKLAPRNVKVGIGRTVQGVWYLNAQKMGFNYLKFVPGSLLGYRNGESIS